MTDRASWLRNASADSLMVRFAFPLRFLGFGFYWAWMTRFWTGSAQSPLGMATVEGATIARITVEATTAIALLIGVLAARRLMHPAGNKVLLLGGAILGPVGTVASALGRNQTDGIPLFLVLAWTSLGIACACITLLWGRFYASIGLRRASAYMPLSLVLAVLLGLVLLNMQPTATIAITALLPLFSIATFLLVAPELPPAEKQEPHNAPPGLALWRLVLAIGVYGVAIGFYLNSRTLFTQSSATSTVRTLVTLIIPLVAFVLLQRNNFRSTYRLTLPLTAAGFLLLPLLPEGANWIGSMVVLAGSNLFDIFTWIAMAGISHHRMLSPFKVFGLGRAANTGGIAVGWLISYLITTKMPFGESPLLGFSLAMVFVLILTTTLVMNDGELPQDETSDDSSTPNETGAPESPPLLGHWRQCCTRVAAEHGLSPREEEVLVLLAKGHSMKHIEETLVITYHTAKSHANHIYKKLDVHSREELIELIERENCGPARANSETHTELAAP
ncbi:MAG: response regulator transcription factor [Coriobacteriia bacterium]